MRIGLTQGDVMRIPLEDQSVHCIVTSPPYWGLRSYSTGENKSLELGSEPLHDCGGWVTGQDCGACFVCNARSYAREFWRVLRDDGTLFLNLGDSYNGSGGAGGDYNAGGLKNGQPKFSGRNVSALKPKDLCGIPWRVALALQSDGWYLRSDIIWHKPNPMPESVTDRPTKAHEYLFLLTKSKRYFYDADAVRERANYDGRKDEIMKGSDKYADGFVPNQAAQSIALRGHERWKHKLKDGTRARNRRTVWKIATRPYSGAHFATFPPDLVEPCIKAGTSERGACPECGAQWVRVVEKEFTAVSNGRKNITGGDIMGGWEGVPRGTNKTTTIGFRPSCDHTADPIPAIVLDPFSGSGTTAMVANGLGRVGIGLELSAEYIRLAKERTGITAMNEWQNGKDGETILDDLPMFGGYT